MLVKNLASCLYIVFMPKHSTYDSYSVIMVGNTLATVISNGDKLPHLRTSMESPCPCPSDSHIVKQIRACGREGRSQVGFARSRGHDHVVLAKWLRGARSISQWKNLLRHGTCYLHLLLYMSKAPLGKSIRAKPNGNQLKEHGEADQRF